MTRIVLAALCAGLILSACGQRYSDSAKYTAPVGYDTTKGQCNPNYNYPPGSPCNNPQPPATTKGMRVTVETINCAANYSYTWGNTMYSGTASSVDRTLSASAGDVIAVTAQSTCGAGGSATVKLYKDSTLVASDSKVGPEVARASATY